VNTFHDGSPEVDESVGASPGDALSGGELQRRAVRGSLWTSIHTISSVPVAFLANAVAARALGVADYGTLAFLTVWFAIAVQIANAGFSASIIQWGASAEARGERAQADDLLRRSMGFHVAVELPLLVAAVWALARGGLS
jgi:O-antigen/teichoic acid export membrane protein